MFALLKPTKPKKVRAVDLMQIDELKEINPTHPIQNVPMSIFTNFLKPEEVVVLSSVSKRLFCLCNRFFTKRITESSRARTIVDQALIGINTYLKEDAPQPHIYDHKIMMNCDPVLDISFPKGLRRALCFQNILSDHTSYNPTTQLAALYGLLQEYDGYALLKKSHSKQLKSRVQAELMKKFGNHFLEMIIEHILTAFTLEQIEEKTKFLVKSILSTEGPLSDVKRCNRTYWSYLNETYWLSDLRRTVDKALSIKIEKFKESTPVESKPNLKD